MANADILEAAHVGLTDTTDEIETVQDAQENLICSRPHKAKDKAIDGEWISDESFIDEWFGPKSLKLIAEMPDVVHGSMTPGGSKASLIVLKFKFQSLTNGRRFKSARITVTFLDITEKTKSGRKEVIAAAPVVERIVPDGCWALGESVETDERTLSEGVNGITGFGFTINAGVQYQHHESGQKTDKATVTGITSLDNSRRKEQIARNEVQKGRVLEEITNSKKYNVVIWNLLENRSTRQGIPTLLQGAILLNRGPPPKPDSVSEAHVKTDRVFEAHVKIKVVTDWKTGFKRSVTHQTTEDKLLRFDPSSEDGGTEIKGFIKNRLDKVDFKALQNVVDTLPMGQPRASTPTTVHSMSEPGTPALDFRGRVYETTNVTVSGGNVMIKGSGVAVIESEVLRAQST